MSLQENMSLKFDVIVIGGGPGGYPAAIRAAQNGGRVALVEEALMGGTCLNWGCIPTKALLTDASLFRQAQHAKEMEIEGGKAALNFLKVSQRKDAVVSRVRSSLEQLIKSNQITVIRGRGKLTSANSVKVLGDENRLIEGKKIILATGSQPADVPAFPCDGSKIHNSDTILGLTALPAKIAIVGGGVIGLEFASLFCDFGVEVTVLELLPSIVAAEAENIRSALHRALTKRGVKISTGVKVQKIDKDKKGITVYLEGGTTVPADMALVAVGRKMRTEGIGLEEVGIPVDKRGVIATNERMQTVIPNIYAVGDITGKWLLAHVASHQGIVAADHAMGKHAKMHYHAVPSVVFTEPEAASVGLSAEKAKELGYQVALGSFPFMALGKAQASQHTDGFAQIVADSRTGQILGAQVVGHEASSLIAEMVLAVHHELTLEALMETIHAHPTLSEVWLEAALLANQTPLHLPPKTKAKDRTHADLATF